jgi:hypothetical protein
VAQYESPYTDLCRGFFFCLFKSSVVQSCALEWDVNLACYCTSRVVENIFLGQYDYVCARAEWRCIFRYALISDVGVIRRARDLME